MVGIEVVFEWEKGPFHVEVCKSVEEKPQRSFSIAFGWWKIHAGITLG